MKYIGKNKVTKYNNEQGQVLLFVIATMAIALAVGTAFSLRTLSTVSRVSTSDTYSRLVAASEGAIERYLRLSSEELDNLTSTCDDFDTTSCIVTYDPVATETITAIVDVIVERFGATNANQYFDVPVVLRRDRTFEVSLNSYSSTLLDICWKPEPSGSDADLYVIAYNANGELTKTGISCSGSCNTGFGSDKSGFIDASPSSNPDYDHCGTVTLPNNPVGVRIRPISADASVGITGGSSLGYQGHVVRARARLSGAEVEDAATKDAAVFKFLPHLPGVFDYSIYSDTGSLVSN